MNGQDTTVNVNSASTARDVMTLGLYSIGIGTGAVAGLVALLLAA